MNLNYSRLLTAYFLSSIGDWFYRLALPIFLFNQTKSPIVMSVTYALTFLPFVLITPFGGVIADRMKRQNLLIYGDFIAFILTLMLALAITFFPYNLTLIYLLVFMVASVTALCHPAFQGFVPLVVEKDYFARANSYILTADNLILMLGPLCSGIVIATFGSVDAIYINAFSFLASSLLTSTIRVKSEEAIHHHKKLTLVGIFIDLKDGVRYSITNPIIKYGCMLFLFVNFGIQIFYSNFMYYLAHNLRLDSKHIGLTFAITGIGSIIGSIIAPKLVKRLPEGRIILISCIAAGIAVLTLFFAKNFWMAGFSWGLESIFSSIIIITYFTLRQHVVPNQFLGRTIAATRVISYLAIPIASVIGGYILQRTHDINILIYIGGITMVLTGCLGWLTPLNTIKQFIKE
ncbi:MAG: MFS transporter [Burkholderiales bacterium]|nr:MFS transporter [Burkholderiales bacterium]